MLQISRSILVMFCLWALFVATLPSVDSSHNSIYRCSDSKALGELGWAECGLDHPYCPAGTCHTWPDVHIRVWADESFEGSLTEMVTGYIGSEEVCRGWGSCEGSFQREGPYGQHEFCYATGPWDGGVVIVWFPAANTPWAVHMECWVDGF